MNNHLVNQITRPGLVQDDTLHVIGVISNTVRWHSRYRLYRDWAEHVAAHDHVKLYTVEAAFGDRHHEVTDAGNSGHLQVRTNGEAWIKENLINLGVRHLLPRTWRYVAWVDCDVVFRDSNWAGEALQQLQHFPVIQPWQNALDLGPTGNVLQCFQSFGHLHQSKPGQPKQVKATDPYPYGHSGYAWACTRTFWEAVGGLIDFAVLGSGDHHMANAMVGTVEATVHGGLGPSYLRRCLDWQRRAMRITHGEVGFSTGRIEHSFHGPKKARGYQNRWQILVQNHYDPDHDLSYDHQGVIHLVGKPQLEQAIRRYNRSRAEDSVEEQ